MLLFVYRAVDWLLDYWPRIVWLVPGVALLNVSLLGWWAWLVELPPVEIIAISLSVVAATMAILTLLPQYLKQILPRPFKVDASQVNAWEQEGDGHVNVNVFILNQSHKKERIVLKFALCVRSVDGAEHWFQEPTLHGFGRGLAYGEHGEGAIDFHTGALSQILGVGPNLYLYVEDLLSERNIRIPLPLSYPEHFRAS